MQCFFVFEKFVDTVFDRFQRGRNSEGEGLITIGAGEDRRRRWPAHRQSKGRAVSPIACGVALNPKRGGPGAPAPL